MSSHARYKPYGISVESDKMSSDAVYKTYGSRVECD